MRERGILVVGDVMTDIIVTPREAYAYGSDCAASIRHHPGGSGANLAVWLGALGCNAHFIGMLGASDEAAFTAYFRARNVMPHLMVSEHKPTGQIVVIIDPKTGERSFLTDRGANDDLTQAHLPADLLDGMGHLHVSAYSLFNAGPREAVLALMQTAKDRGLTLSVDASSASNLAAVSADRFLDWVKDVDILAVNQQEAMVLAQEWEVANQLGVLALHCPIVLLKQGADGASVYCEGVFQHMPAERVDCINSAGAGDAALAGFLSAHLAGDSLGAALRQAVIQGARAVSGAGAQTRAFSHD